MVEKHSIVVRLKSAFCRSGREKGKQRCTQNQNGRSHWNILFMAGPQDPTGWLLVRLLEKQVRHLDSRILGQVLGADIELEVIDNLVIDIRFVHLDRAA